MHSTALTGVALLEYHPMNQKVAGWIPGQDTYILRLLPGWGRYGGIQLMFLSNIDVSLTLFLSFFFSLSKSSEKMSLGDDLKNNKK